MTRELSNNKVPVHDFSKESSRKKMPDSTIDIQT
jgi:hypothetical protein